MVPPHSPQFPTITKAARKSEKPTTGDSNYKYLTANK